jgi:hypothetical protein
MTSVTVTQPTPDADIITEASRLIDAARLADVPLRLVGGLAVRLHVRGTAPIILERDYQDIDLVTLRGRSRQVREFMTSMGYEQDRSFNALNGDRRLLFYDTAHQRQVDVFVGSFEMCHTIPITERIDLATHGIPLAELLLTKMQIVKLNPKDQADIITMLYHHEVADDDAGRINATRVAELCAADWGLWRTTKMNTERVLAALPTAGLSRGQEQTVRDRLEQLWRRIEVEPKSARWKLRSKVGDRKRWYDDPEEVE